MQLVKQLRAHDTYREMYTKKHIKPRSGTDLFWL